VSTSDETPLARGRLLAGAQAPPDGEATHLLAAVGGTRIEQILSGRLASPQEYVQDHDEWVVVLQGAAVLEVGDHRLDLQAGQWVLLPAGQWHRLVSTEPGTSWLAVHVDPSGAG
jgi:cupin 2 domain-containing protein